MEPGNLENLLEKVKAVAQGPNADLLEKFIDLLYEHEELTQEEWAAIREGQEDARQGRVITLEEYEKARDL